MQKFPNSLSNTGAKKLLLSGLTIPEIAAALKSIPGAENVPPFRAKQLFSWIQQGALSFENMTSIPQNLKKILTEYAVISNSKVQETFADKDGTIKLAVTLEDGTVIETVLLETENGRFTACISTQAGCPMGCVFCKTGSLGFSRNLSAPEIVEQFLFLSGELAKKEKISIEQKKQKISHLVIMGMGEPLLNLQALRKALEILCDPKGFNLSKRKITISTSGICEGIIDLAENGPETELALSIPSARENLRSRLMPGTAKYPLSEVKEALMFYQKKQGRRITLETVLLGGINTGSDDARSLIDFSKNLDAAVNIIPWNPVQDLSFEGIKLHQCSPHEIENFIRMLKKGGLSVTRRYRRGRGISGACGQLGIVPRK